MSSSVSSLSALRHFFGYKPQKPYIHVDMCMRAGTDRARRMNRCKHGKPSRFYISIEKRPNMIQRKIDIIGHYLNCAGVE